MVLTREPGARRARRSGAVAALAAAALALAGCASGGATAGETSRLLRSRGLDPGAVTVPFEVTPEMGDWARAHAPGTLRPEDRLRRLLRGLMQELGLHYDAGRTTTAREVFAEKRANCLGFTSLLVGLAREVGVPAFYLAIDDIERFKKDGDLVVVSNHVSAGFSTGPEVMVLDFTSAPVADYRQARAISDLTAIALFYSNRGAERLRAGDVAAAIEWLKTAVAIDPDLAGARVNLGVALRRTGDEAGAEAAYRTALEADPQAISAYQNLAALLRRHGKEGEAEELLELAGKLGSRNPYSYLNLGDLNLRHRRLEEARRFYRKALRLYREDAEPYAAMGLWALAAGDAREARKWLRRAREIDGANDRVKLLESQLARLPEGAAGRAG